MFHSSVFLSASFLFGLPYSCLSFVIMLLIIHRHLLLLRLLLLLPLPSPSSSSSSSSSSSFFSLSVSVLWPCSVSVLLFRVSLLLMHSRSHKDSLCCGCLFFWLDCSFCYVYCSLTCYAYNSKTDAQHNTRIYACYGLRDRANKCKLCTGRSPYASMFCVLEHINKRQHI